MIDAQLGDPASLSDGFSAELLHQRLFDVELALTNIARFAQAMTRLDLPDDQRSQARLGFSISPTGTRRREGTTPRTSNDLLAAPGRSPRATTARPP